MQYQKFLPPSFVPRRISVHSLYEEMAKPASRFRKPLTLSEKVVLGWHRFTSKHLVTHDSIVPLLADVPLQWRIIFNYLYKEGVIETPVVGSASFRNDKPKKMSVNLRPHFDGKYTDAHEGSYYGFGSGTSLEVSLSKAVGELLERHAGAQFKKNKLLKASSKQLHESGRLFLHPKKVSQFAVWQKEQFTEFAFTEDTPFRWVRTRELISKRLVLIPAQLGYWYFLNSSFNEKEPLLLPQTTNGGAGHFTYEEAVLAAVHECIQRDNFLIYWMNTLSPKVIDTAGIDDDSFKEMMKYLKRFDGRAVFLDITTDTKVPTSACVLICNEGGHPTISMGAGNGSSALESLLSGLYEAISTQSVAKEVRDATLFDVSAHEPYTRTNIGRAERIALWHGKEMLQKLQFFISGEIETFASFAKLFTPYESAKEELAELLSHLKNMGEGYEVYVHEMKSKVLRTLGYHVVKVVIPNLVSLHLSEHEAGLGALRLQSTPAKLGYTVSKRNPLPHPFP